MPTTYAHYRFGKNGLNLFTIEDRQAVEYYRPLYDIGEQGPDIFFYYKPWQKNYVNETGHAMHKSPMMDFLKRAKTAYDKTKHKDAIKAYVFGFTGHFLLDSFCHTYIEEKLEADPLATHNQIESELDRALMERDNINPFTDSPGFSLRPSKKKAILLSEIYPEFTPDIIFLAIKQQRIFVDLFTPSNSIKRAGLLSALKISGNIGFRDKIIEKTVPDCTKDSTPVLISQYYKALERYPEMIEEVKDYLETGKEPSFYFNRHFGAWYETD